MQPDPTPPLDLDAIRARYDYAVERCKVGTAATEFTQTVAARASAADVPTLIAEVTALRAEVERLQAANANLIRNAEILADEIVLGSPIVTTGPMTQPDARAERTDCCPGGLLHTTDCPVYLDNAARAERTSFPMKIEANEAALAVLAELSAERTEPATGEDVETLSLVVEALRALKLRGPEPALPYNDFALTIIAERILAALDLPGREWALREAAARWAAALIKSREEWRGRAEQASRERDAATAALADVARLLDEARVERDAAQAEVAEEIAVRLDKLAPLIDKREKPSVALEVAAAIARQHAGGEGGGSDG